MTNTNRTARTKPDAASRARILAWTAAMADLRDCRPLSDPWKKHSAIADALWKQLTPAEQNRAVRYLR